MGVTSSIDSEVQLLSGSTQHFLDYLERGQDGFCTGSAWNEYISVYKNFDVGLFHQKEKL